MRAGLFDFGALLVSRLLLLIVGIGTQSLLAWVLGPGDRGSYAACLVFAAILTVVCSIGCGGAGAYHVASKKLSLSEGMIDTAIFGLLSSALAIVVGLVVMRFPWAFFEKASPQAFYVALGVIPATLLSQLLIQILTAARLFGWTATMSVANSVVNFLLAVLFVAVLPWGVTGALVANIAAGAITTLAVVVLVRVKFAGSWVAPTMANMYSMAHYGFRYYFGKLSNVANYQLGTILLAFFLGRIELGLFAVAAQVTDRVMLIPDTLSTILMPRVAESADGRQDLVAQCARVTAVICGAVLLFVAVLAKPLIYVLFSPAFLPAVPLVQIIAIGVFVRCVSKVFVPYLSGTNRPGLASWPVAVGAAVNLAVLLWLLPRIGLLGAAVGMSAGYCASSLLLVLIFHRVSGLSFRQVWRFQTSDWEILGGILRRVSQIGTRRPAWSSLTRMRNSRGTRDGGP